MRIKLSTAERSSRSRIVAAMLFPRPNFVPSAARPIHIYTTTTGNKDLNCAARSVHQTSRSTTVGKDQSRPNTSVRTAIMRSSAGKCGVMSSSTNAATIIARPGSMPSNSSTRRNRICVRRVHRNSNSAIPTVNIFSKPKSSFIQRQCSLLSTSVKSTTLRISSA